MELEVDKVAVWKVTVLHLQPLKSQQTKGKLTHLSHVTFHYHWCAPLGWGTKWDLAGVFFPSFHASVCLHVCFWVICFLWVIPFEYARAINLSASCLINCLALVRWTGLNIHISLYRQNCWAWTLPNLFQPKCLISWGRLTSTCKTVSKPFELPCCVWGK